MRIDSVGYGAGDRDFKEHANVVRVMIGETSGAAELTTVTVIEANIDDSSPQVIAYAIERLLRGRRSRCRRDPRANEKGPPGRSDPGDRDPEKREEIVAILFRETTTLGVRFTPPSGASQSRDVGRSVEHAAWGAVRIKVSDHGFAPEYEDARKIAAASGVPLKQILAEAAHAYLKRKQ